MLVKKSKKRRTQSGKKFRVGQTVFTVWFDDDKGEWVFTPEKIVGVGQFAAGTEICLWDREFFPPAPNVFTTKAAAKKAVERRNESGRIWQE